MSDAHSNFIPTILVSGVGLRVYLEEKNKPTLWFGMMLRPLTVGLEQPCECICPSHPLNRACIPFLTVQVSPDVFRVSFVCPFKFYSILLSPTPDFFIK